MRRLVLPLAIAVAAVGFGAGTAQAATSDSATSCANIFNICMDWNLNLSGSTWTLTTTYVSSPSGLMTSTGIYYNAGSTAPAYGIGAVTITNPLTGWGTGCNDLNFNNGTTSLLGACGSTTNGINDAVGPGGTVVITFTTSNLALFESDLGAGKLDYRAHIQGYGATSCSIKLDTGVQGGVGTAGDNCVPSNSVPEPITMALLGTGMAGLGFIRRRRKGTDVVSE